jgi:hypothetical protein
MHPGVLLTFRLLSLQEISGEPDFTGFYATLVNIFIGKPPILILRFSPKVLQMSEDA